MKLRHSRFSLLSSCLVLALLLPFASGCGRDREPAPAPASGKEGSTDGPADLRFIPADASALVCLQVGVWRANSTLAPTWKKFTETAAGRRLDEVFFRRMGCHLDDIDRITFVASEETLHPGRPAEATFRPVGIVGSPPAGKVGSPPVRKPSPPAGDEQLMMAALVRTTRPVEREKVLKALYPRQWAFVGASIKIGVGPRPASPPRQPEPSFETFRRGGHVCYRPKGRVEQPLNLCFVDDRTFILALSEKMLNHCLDRNAPERSQFLGAAREQVRRGAHLVLSLEPDRLSTEGVSELPAQLLLTVRPLLKARTALMTFRLDARATVKVRLTFDDELQAGQGKEALGELLGAGRAGLASLSLELARSRADLAGWVRGVEEAVRSANPRQSDRAVELALDVPLQGGADALLR